jgi:DNA-directed RNA polymerase subunit beta
VVLDKKLFARAVKINAKHKIKCFRRFRNGFETKFVELNKLVELFLIVNGKTSQGVMNDLGGSLPKYSKKCFML